MKQLLLSFLILLGFSGGTFAEDKKETVELFILAGQSNAQGWMGDAAQYPAEASMPKSASGGSSPATLLMRGNGPP